MQVTDGQNHFGMVADTGYFFKFGLEPGAQAPEDTNTITREVIDTINAEQARVNREAYLAELAAEATEA